MLDELHIRAQSFIQTEQFDQARQLLVELIGNDPNDIEALNDLAVVEIMQGKYQSGIELLNEVLLIDKNNSVALGNIEFAKTKLNK